MNREFRIIENFQNDKRYLNEFHEFISKVFPGISFKEWEEKGFWTTNYIPFSLINNDKIISNVCASLMQIVINGKEYSAVQLGAVATLPDFRNKGLSKKLMDYSIEKLEPKTDFFFLYANESVLNFYPKFGFKKFDEYLFIKLVKHVQPNPYLRKLNLNDSKDYSLLQNLLSNRIQITKLFGALNFQSVTMWHILNIYRDDLYYLERENVIFIKLEKGNELSIIDVICTERIDIDSLIPKLIQSQNITKIKLYFPPDQLIYQYDKLEKENTDLFIRGNINLPNEPYRFSLTAIT